MTNPVTVLLTSVKSRLWGPAAKAVAATGPVPGYRCTTVWRKRPKGWPRSHTYWRTRGYHTGSDFSGAGVAGKPIRALNSGYAIRRDDAMLGNAILIFWIDEKSGKKYTTWYCHCASRTPLNSLPSKTISWNQGGSRGDARVVRAGQQIGTVGHSGDGAQGNHLHLERRAGWSSSWSGKDLDPMWGWGR